MDQHLQFKIGSTFNGEGFDKLSNAAKKSASTVSRVTNAAGDLITQIGGIDKETNALVKTGGRLISGFLSMGIWGAAIAAVTSVVGWMKKLKDATEEARLAAKGLSKEYMTLEAAAKGYQRRVESWKNKAKEAAEAEKKAATDKANADKLAIDNAKKLQSVLDKQAETKEKIAALDDETKSGAAQRDVNNAKRKLTYEMSFGDSYSQSLAQAELDLAQAKLLKAIKDEAEEREANAAEIERQREAERNAMEMQRESLEEQIRQNKISNAERELANAESGAAKNQDEVAKAKEALKEAIEKYKDNMAKNEVNRSIGISSENSKTPGLSNFWGDLIKNRKLIQDETAQVAVERGLKDGSIRTVEDMRRVRNAAARSANSEIDSQATKQAINEQQRADRLQKMIDDGHSKSLSKNDRQFLDDFNAAKDARDAQQNEIKQQQQRVAAAKAAEEQSFKDIADIKKKLEKLGLK